MIYHLFRFIAFLIFPLRPLFTLIALIILSPFFILLAQQSNYHYRGYLRWTRYSTVPRNYDELEQSTPQQQRSGGVVATWLDGWRVLWTGEIFDWEGIRRVWWEKVPGEVEGSGLEKDPSWASRQEDTKVFHTVLYIVAVTVGVLSLLVMIVIFKMWRRERVNRMRSREAFGAMGEGEMRRRRRENLLRLKAGLPEGRCEDLVEEKSGR